MEGGYRNEQSVKGMFAEMHGAVVQMVEWSKTEGREGKERQFGSLGELVHEWGSSGMAVGNVKDRMHRVTSGVFARSWKRPLKLILHPKSRP